MKKPGPVESHIAPPHPTPLKLSNYSLFPCKDTAALIAEAVHLQKLQPERFPPSLCNPGPNSWANSWLAKTQKTPARTVTADLGTAGKRDREYQVTQGEFPSASPVPKSLPSLVPHRSSERCPKAYFYYFKLLLKFLGAFMALTCLHLLSLWEAENLVDLFLK